MAEHRLARWAEGVVVALFALPAAGALNTLLALARVGSDELMWLRSVVLLTLIGWAAFRLRFRHVPWLWLVANCNAALTSDPDPVALLILIPLWLVASVIVVLLPWVAPGQAWPGRLLAFAAALASLVAAYELPRFAAHVQVWTHEREMLAKAQAALAARAAPDGYIKPLEIDRRDDPPVRVAFYWHASHGDVDGVVYDPTGRVVDRGVSGPWLYGARAWHLFGPWYRFMN